MTVKEQLIEDIQTVNDPALLLQIADFMASLKKEASLQLSTENPAFALIGSLNDREAQSIQKVIDEEFNHIEGEW